MAVRVAFGVLLSVISQLCVVFPTAQTINLSLSSEDSEISDDGYLIFSKGRDLWQLAPNVAAQPFINESTISSVAISSGFPTKIGRLWCPDWMTSRQDIALFSRNRLLPTSGWPWRCIRVAGNVTGPLMTNSLDQSNQEKGLVVTRNPCF